MLLYRAGTNVTGQLASTQAVTTVKLRFFVISDNSDLLLSFNTALVLHFIKATDPTYREEKIMV